MITGVIHSLNTSPGATDETETIRFIPHDNCFTNTDKIQYRFDDEIVDGFITPRETKSYQT